MALGFFGGCAVHDGRVLVASDRLRCLRLRDGALLWEAEPLRQPGGDDYFWGAPVIACGLVLAGSGAGSEAAATRGRVSAYRLADGVLRWSTPLVPEGGNGGGVLSPVSVDLARRRLRRDGLGVPAPAGLEPGDLLGRGARARRRAAALERPAPRRRPPGPRRQLGARPDAARDRGHGQGRRLGVGPPLPGAHLAARPHPGDAGRGRSGGAGQRAGGRPDRHRRPAVPRALERRRRRRTPWPRRSTPAAGRCAGGATSAGSPSPRPRSPAACCARRRPPVISRCSAPGTAGPSPGSPSAAPARAAVAAAGGRIVFGIGAEPFLPGGELICVG